MWCLVVVVQKRHCSARYNLFCARSCTHTYTILLNGNNIQKWAKALWAPLVYGASNYSICLSHLTHHFTLQRPTFAPFILPLWCVYVYVCVWSLRTLARCTWCRDGIKSALGLYIPPPSTCVVQILYSFRRRSTETLCQPHIHKRFPNLIPNFTLARLL